TDTCWSIDGLEVQIEDELYFQVVASTQIDWGAINWQPLIYYTATDNPDIMVYAQDGTPLISFCPAVDFTMYNNTVQKASAWIAPVDGVLEIMPTITGAPGIIDLSGPATVSVKSINRLIIKDDYRLSSATAAPLVIDVTAGDTLFVEIHSQNPFAGDLDPDLTGVRFNGGDQSIKVGLYLANKSDQMLFGPLYRGWGGFVYDGNGLRGVLPIDESKLEIDTALADSEIDPDEFDFENPEELEGKFEKSNPIFTILMIDGKNQCWNGVDNLTYIKDSIMSSSRNGLDDISDPEFSVAGIGIQAPSRIFKSQMHSVAGGADAGVSSLTAGYSNNNTKLIQDIQDLNGDRYPDVLRESGIYYSTPGGDREKTQVTFTLGLHEASSYAVGGSLGGGYVTSSASNSGDSRSNNKKVNRTKGKQGNMSKKASKATESASNSAGISGEFNYDQDEIISTWMDMNGDGLVDKINKDGMVSLNLGYSFAEPVSWGITGIRGGDSYDYGGGLGINYANGSIVAGVSLNRTENFTKFALEDLNGDGLPDYIVSVDPLMVRFNTGAGFAPTVEWTALQAIEEGSSVGESVNVAFTACVNLFGFRICVNPNFATGQGVSRQLMQLVDIDNDGFLDILRSNHDGDLSVQLSQVGRTNMLKKITRPLGGSIALDYEITGNNYDLPFGQWVLSAIISHDGFDPDRSPLTKTRIVYEGAKMDRRERESYGFSKVIIQELDSEQQDSIYRIVEQNYLQDHYYNKGLLSSECIKNSDGLKFVETTYSYQMLDPQNLQPLPSSELIQHRQVFPALYQKVDTYYERMVAPQLSHRMEYTYDPKGNVIRMVDYGDGSESDQLTIDYSYHDLDDLEIYDLMKSKIISNQNEVLRKTEYDIDVSGNIIEERNYLEDGTFAVTEKEYDEFGNLTKIIYPKNASGQRSFEEFQYDEVIQTYRVSKTDQFGYTTRYKYDFLFGRLIELIDINQNQFSWTLDAKGREMYYLDPLGQKAGVDHTIAYEYKHQAIPAYSLVRHYDASLDHYIETFQFIDGFLRPIQNKKTALVQQTPTQDPQLSMTVSGWMKYDAFGRMQLLYHPIAEPEADKEQVNTSRHPAQPVKIGYDILDRVIQTNLQDGSIMRDIHNIAPDRDGNLLFKTMSIDALGNKSATYTDVRGRKRAKSEFDEEGEIWTTFSYNAVDELVQSSNHFLYSTLYQYDHFGRLIEKQFPDQGPTNFYYDLAGNMTHKITANIREKIPNGGRIKYTYDFDRLIRIDYPKNIQNTVIYHYGTADSEFNRAGRVWLVEDASGGQEYFYNELGQVIKNYRTVIVDQTNISTYVTAFEYDSWKRIKKLIYPDNEIVTYHYDQGGNVTRIVGEKEGHTYRYIDAMGYDAFGDLIYQKLGNGVESVHRFEDGRRRVSSIESKTASGTIFNSNQYQYDAEDNLTLWSRQADPSIGIGGEENYAYQYDPLYRISNATGSFNGQENAEFFISLSYDKLYNITAKSEKMVKNANQIDTAFEQQYQYSFERPHQLSSKNGQEYEFDANGNLSERTSQITFDHRQLIWDEEDRMMGVAENGILSQYTYDAADRRVIKSSGGSRGIFLDGAAAGIVNHQDNYKVYVNPFLTIEQDQFTKHYYIGSQRFMSKIGTGKFVHDLIPTFRKLYAGNLDFSKRQYLIQQTLQNYYKELGIPPGPPTLFGYYAQPDITGSPLPQNDTLSAYTAPPLDWPLPIGPPDTTGPPGQPIWVEAETELGRPGYGFIGDDVFSEINQFFYHSDHLGSTAYVTDLTGTIRQFTSYQPFGKTFVQQKNTPESQPYLFNSKELDENTGLVYFGARYLDSESSVWQNVDPLAEKYPSISPYAFVGQNPVNYIDPDGKKIAIHYRYRNQNKVFKFGSRQVPNNKFVKETLKSFVYLGQSKTALKLIDQAHHLPQTIHIRQIRELGKENFLPYKRQIEYNPQSGLSLDNGGEMTPALGLLHELDHAVEYIRNEKQYFHNRKKELPGYDNAEEKRVIRGVEYQAAIELGEGTRSDHLGRTIETEGPTTTKRRRVLKGKNKAGNRNFTMGRKGML
ncbi:MAG: hypothetical protein HKN76_17985, partial [Saprospiraceae bacterium]|nr:hypothetical protein [Saprospiraceae bacterium]